MVNLVNGRKLAELAGCSPAGVSKAKKAGNLPERDDGLYDLADEQVSFWIANSGHKRGARLAELEEALRPDDDPAEAVAEPGEAVETKTEAARPEGCAPEPDENALRVSAKIDGEWRTVARYIFTGSGAAEVILSPLPRPVRFVFNYGRSGISAVVREIVGDILETYVDGSPKARAAALEILEGQEAI